MEKTVNVLERLASALGRKDEKPNQKLAEEIVAAEDTVSIKILINGLQQKKAVAHDCIKVLYEIGERNPVLIASYLEEFMKLLKHKNNRLQWGGMVALYWIAQTKPAEIYNHIVDILAAVASGSVITRDYAVNILIHLASLPAYTSNALSLLIEQLVQSPVNQLPMYAERALPVITQESKERFLNTLTTRLNDIDKESKRKRVEKVIKKVNAAFS